MIVNKHRMLQWALRLESGDILQGMKRLHYVSGKMCCLGVATELARENGVQLRREVVDENLAPHYVYSWDTDVAHPWDTTTTFLPTPVSEWLGIDDSDPMLKATPPVAFYKTTASGANDALYLDFDAIASMIRNTYLDNDDPCCDGVDCPDASKEA